MTQEEKAKAYDEAIKRAKELLEIGLKDTRDKRVVLSFFPELKESEGMKTKRMLDIITYKMSQHQPDIFTGEENEWFNAWLEKQDEQNQNHFELKAGHWYICHRAFCCRADHLTVKEGERFMCEKDGVVKGFVFKEPEKYFKEVCAPAPIEDENKSADMVEPKFKVGDWVINTITKGIEQIIELTGSEYICSGHLIISYNEQHLLKSWTIQDAKDGDVLSFNDGHGNDCIELIKSITGKKIEFWFCLTNGNRYEVFDGIIPYTNLVSREDATPATKEQCDLLFQKMKEAGYEWDAKKKELKKIEQKPATMSLDEAIEHCKKKSCGNSACALEHKQLEKWLTELKELKEQKPVWSEKDENLFKCAIDAVREESKVRTDGCLDEEVGEMVTNWLNSLKERYTWKPSDEQMKALWEVYKGGKEQASLATLYSDLKKLRKE